MDNKMNSNGKQAEVRNDTRDFRRFIEETFAVKEASRFQYPAFSIQHPAFSIQINLDAENNGG